MSDTQLTLEQPKPSPMVTEPQGGLVEQLAYRIVNSPDVTTETLREVLKMQNEQEDRRRAHEIEDRQWKAKQLFNEAFSLCKGEMPQVAKDSYNDQTNSHYAAVEAIDLAISPVMVKHGFAITFASGGQPKDDQHMHVIGTLIHKGGHEKEYEDQVPIAGVGMKGARMMTHTHGYGATKTYARRYLKLDIWDVAVMDKDSDGNINNQSVGERAQVLLDQIAGADSVSAIDLVHADVMAETTLSPSDRKKVISTFSFRRGALLEAQPNA